jgi:TolB-like protein/Flp pilus assembly protein TadD/predicted Ser/Thr protein kinase
MEQERLSALFERAIALQPAERPDFVRKSARGDTELAAELGSLLASHEEAPDFLEGMPATIVTRALRALAETPLEQSTIDQLRDRYEILERLGSGGMGVVYKARDLRLGRLVALKFLRPHLTGDDSARERLLAEARAVSVLDHANIAVVHEIGEIRSGGLFISMTFYQGETLQERLTRGPLSAEHASRLALQIARALAAAHRTGVVHCDIKPSNVLITAEGLAKLVDFGIARVVGAESTEGGPLRGTIAYMSPEQTRGGAPDPRTDLWAFGIVLCEALTGERPFRNEHEADLIDAIRNDDPAIDRGPEIPRSLTRIIGRCLEKDPLNRYQSAEEVIADLEGLAHARVVNSRRRGRVAVGVPLAILLTAGLLSSHGDAPFVGGLGTPAPYRLAVYPLGFDGSDLESAYLADQLTDELIERLSTLRDLRVFEADASTTPDVAGIVGARSILQGRVSRTGRRVLVSLQLAGPESPDPLWSQRYAGDPEDMFALQLQIAQDLARALHIRIRSDERRQLAKRGTESAEAYTLYLRGRHFLEKQDEASARRALALFQQALDLDPTYAHAWTGIANVYYALAALSVLPTDEAYPPARAAATRALELDEELSSAHEILAIVLSYYYWNLPAADEHFRRAIELEPGNSGAHGRYAEHLRNQGRFEESLREIRTAQDLDPLSREHQIGEGIILYLAGRHDEAIQVLDRLLDLNPGFRYPLFFTALIKVQQKRYDEALADLQAMDPDARTPDSRSLRGYIYAATNRAADARMMIATLDATVQPVVSPFHAAVIHVGLGERERAIDLLWEAYRLRTWQVRLLKVEPLFDPLRSEPRFQALLEEIGLGEEG